MQNDHVVNVYWYFFKPWMRHFVLSIRTLLKMFFKRLIMTAESCQSYHHNIYCTAGHIMLTGYYCCVNPLRSCSIGTVMNTRFPLNVYKIATAPKVRLRNIHINSRTPICPPSFSPCNDKKKFSSAAKYQCARLMLSIKR
jgi:hypothetical protein